MEDEIGYCPAEEMDHDFEGDPDHLRDDRDERRRLDSEEPTDDQ